jgi:hypothetical protein
MKNLNQSIMTKIGDWYYYENGERTHVFQIVDIDGEHLMFNSHAGYCDVFCRPATPEEVVRARHFECQPLSCRR